MNGFIVNITIEDCVRDNCCKSCRQKSLNITNTNQTIALQCDYILNVISVNNRSFTVLIQNGIQTIVRHIFTTFDTQICLPNKCKHHLLTISGTITPSET